MTVYTFCLHCERGRGTSGPVAALHRCACSRYCSSFWSITPYALFFVQTTLRSMCSLRVLQICVFLRFRCFSSESWVLLIRNKMRICGKGRNWEQYWYLIQSLPTSIGNYLSAFLSLFALFPYWNHLEINGKAGHGETERNYGDFLWHPYYNQSDILSPTSSSLFASCLLDPKKRQAAGLPPTIYTK